MNTLKRDLKATFKWLDANKFRLYQMGIHFMCTVNYGDGDTQTVGMATGGEMSVLILEQIYNMEKGAVGVTTEQFIDSVRENYLRYKKARDRDDNYGTVTRYDPEDGGDKHD